ncbi:MAG: hypothetical protein RMM98_13975, partial [Acidobacteriota bacterium]|nr:hypothetical protein [Acidobacteriota bacterium]
MKFTILAILASFGLTVLLPVVVHSPPRVSAQFVPRQMIEGPYWTVQSGFESWLMVSNTSDEPIQVFPEFFAANGQRVELPALALRQRERQHLNLRQWLSAQKVTFTWGSLRFRHTGKEFSLAAQVTVTQPEASWSFDFPLDNRDWFYRSTVLDGLWWLPDESSAAQLILTNTGEQPVTVRPTLLINGQPRALAPLTLQPHQVRQVSLGEALAALNLTAPLPTNGGLRIEHDGEPGDVLAYVMVHNDQGFSTTIRCVDPAMRRSRGLHGAGLFIKPSSVPGVSLTSFDTLLLLGNTTGADIQATVRVTYTVGLLTKTATLPALRLAPYQVKQVALNEALARAGLPRRIDSAGLEIAYTSEPGSVVAHAVSFDRSASMAFDVLIKDPDALPTNTFAFPWRLTGQTRSVVQIKNTRQEVGQFQLKLVHEAGEWDWGVQAIGPGETVTLDIRALRDRQIGSDQDQVIPRWIERGQAQWTDVSPQRGLIGRVIIYDPRLKINTSTNEWGGGNQTSRPWGCIRWGVEGSEGPCVAGPSGPDPNQPPVTQSLPLGQVLELPVWGKRVECDTGALFENINLSTSGALTFAVNPPNSVTIRQIVQEGNRFVRISRIQAGTVDVTARFTTDFYWPNCERIIGDDRVLTATLRLTDATGQITVQVPDGGEDWPIGSVQTIRWNSVNVTGNVKIELSRNGGSSYETLVASQPNTGSVSWQVTGPPTSHALIKISSVTTPSVSDTSNGVFILRQPPTGPPLIESITPGVVTSAVGNLPHLRMGFVNENMTTRLTLTGSNLNGATLSIPPSQQPSCAPSISIVSVDPAGRTMQLDAFVPTHLCFVFYQYYSTNYVPTALVNSYGYQAFNLSVVPARLKISSYTPAIVRPGSMYALSVVGYHLNGATLTSEDPSRLQISNVSVRQLDSPFPLFVMNGLVQISEDAAGQVEIRVSGAMGMDTEPIVIDPQVPLDAPATADGLQTFTIAADLVTPIYFQTPKVLDELPDQPAGTNQGGVAFGARYNPFHFRWFASLIACRGTVCPPLNNFPLTPVNITGLVIGVSIDVSLEFVVYVTPSPIGGLGVNVRLSICARVSGWAGIIGGPATAFSVGLCYGGPPPSISQSRITGMSYASTGCLAVGNLFQLPGYLNATVRAIGCCPGTLQLNFSSLIAPDGNGARPEEIGIIPWEVRLTSYRPELTRVEFSPSEVQVEPGGASTTVLLRAYVINPGTGEGGQDVTVRVNRDNARSLPCIISNVTPVSLTQFVPANNVAVPFVFAVQLSALPGCALPGLLAYRADMSLDAGVNSFACTSPGVEPSATLLVRRVAQKTARIKSTTFNPTTTNPGGSSVLTVTVETENVTSQDFLQVYVELSLPSVGCGLLTAVAPGESNPQGKLGSSSGLIDFRFTIIVPAGCSVPTGTATWKADLVNLPSNITKLRPVQDSAVLSIQPGQLASYIKPRVMSLAVGQSKQ